MSSITYASTSAWLFLSHLIATIQERFVALVTPTILKRHFALCCKLAEIGVTEKYSRFSVQCWKRHIVRTNSSFRSRMIARLVVLSRIMCGELDNYETKYPALLKYIYFFSLPILDKSIERAGAKLHKRLEEKFGDSHTVIMHRYAHWKKHSPDDVLDEIPIEVLRTVDKTAGLGTPVVEKAYIGSEGLDPFLTLTVLPRWLNDLFCCVGITYFNLTVHQWDDPTFDGSKYDRKVSIR